MVTVEEGDVIGVGAICRAVGGGGQHVRRAAVHRLLQQITQIRQVLLPLCFYVAHLLPFRGCVTFCVGFLLSHSSHTEEDPDSQTRKIIPPSGISSLTLSPSHSLPPLSLSICIPSSLSSRLSLHFRD